MNNEDDEDDYEDGDDNNSNNSRYSTKRKTITSKFCNPFLFFFNPTPIFFILQRLDFF